MHRYFFTTAIFACVSLAALDAFAQRGGRGGRPGAGQSPAGAAGGRGGQFGAGQGNATDSLFTAIDVNGDGVITRAEMQNAIQLFARLDGDNDGRLSREEAGSTGRASGRRGGGRGQAAGGQGAGGRGQGAGGQGAGGRGQGAGGRGGRGRGNSQTAVESDGTIPQASRSRSAPSRSPSPFDAK